MKYLRTYEQISNGKESYLIMTSDKKYFIKYDALLKDNRDYDLEVSGFVLRPASEIEHTHLTESKEMKERDLHIFKQDRTDKFVITPDVTYYDGRGTLGDLILNDSSKLDSINKSLWNPRKMLKGKAQEEIANVILTALELSTAEDKEVQAMLWSTENSITIELVAEEYVKIVNDLIIVKFFIGYQEVTAGEEDNYLNI